MYVTLCEDRPTISHTPHPVFTSTHSSCTLAPTMARSRRLEWISLLYLLLFVLAVTSPSLIRHDFFGIGEDHVEEILIFFFGLSGLTTFSLYEHLFEKKEKEHAVVETKLDKTKRELVASYEYIGSVNRQLEALKKLANETAGSIDTEDRMRKELFRSIIAGAAALLRSEHGAIRFVSLNKLRTIKEILIDPSVGISVSNRDLLEVHLRDHSHHFIRDDRGRDILVVPSSRKDMDAKAFLLLPTVKQDQLEIDGAFLRVYANQAELLYRVAVQKQDGGPIADASPVIDVP